MTDHSSRINAVILGDGQKGQKEPKSVEISRKGASIILSSHHPRLRTGGNGRGHRAVESSLRIWYPSHALTAAEAKRRSMISQAVASSSSRDVQFEPHGRPGPCVSGKVLTEVMSTVRRK
ncbi:hypothetical protein PspLS_00152 [Pyricularia sp. CBS 133598]|nr:hypothetical protein PspLS_00152 [Pyricularia sp. CBS 133598]